MSKDWFTPPPSGTEVSIDGKEKLVTVISPLDTTNLSISKEDVGKLFTTRTYRMLSHLGTVATGDETDPSTRKHLKLIECLDCSVYPYRSVIIPVPAEVIEQVAKELALKDAPK